jgi:2,3-dihydroxybiphenyl 1,2-dioxygenase
MSIGSLGYLGLRVKDPRSFETFATRVLGLMPVENDGATRYRLDELGWRIAVEEGDADDVAYLGFEVSSSAELEGIRTRLQEAGVAVERGTPEHVAAREVVGLISCKDPDGLPVEIFYGPTLRTEAPFASPVGVSGFVTGAQGLGHVVLSTRDVAAARRFYQDLLGFRLSDTIRMRMGRDLFVDMEFFHCNPRHHTLALIPMPMPKRLHHFMLQVASLDAVGFALERAQAAKSPITMTLGRHTNDRMVSFYTRAPAGFEVEFGFGAIEVDDATWRVTRHDRGSSWGHKRPAN